MVSTKQAVLRGPQDLHIEDRDLDTDNLGSHELWIDTEISALKIGTDRGNYEGAAYGLNEAAYPRFVGDSTVGIVRGVGSEVSRFEVGDRVAYRSGHGSGHIYDERRHIAKVPDEVEPEDAVWAHLYTLSGLCYRKANFAPGENVAVVGLGVLGLGAVALGPLFGGRVVGLANSPIRMEMAMKMGAHAAYLSDDPDLQAKGPSWTSSPAASASTWLACLPDVRTDRPEWRQGLHSQPARPWRAGARLQPTGAGLVLRQRYLSDRGQRHRRLHVSR